MERLDSVGGGWGWHDLSATSSGGRLAVWFGSETVRQPEFPWEWRHERDIVGMQPAYPPGWTLLGFGFRTRHAARREPPFGINSSTLVIVPYWQVFVVAAVLPAWRAAAWARRRRRNKPGHCSRCGYDLRATPDRCPECGAVPAKGAA
jgi:hypothetical protein